MKLRKPIPKDNNCNKYKPGMLCFISLRLGFCRFCDFSKDNIAVYFLEPTESESKNRHSSAFRKHHSEVSSLFANR